MEKRKNTVNIILKAATKAFAEAGFAGARMDAIAKRAKVNKATIYYTIGNKEALYKEVLLATMGKTLDQAEAAMKTPISPEAKLRIFIRNLAGTIDNNPALPNILMWEHASGGRHLPEMVAGEIARMVNLLMAILEEGKRKKQFRSVTPMLIQFMIVATMMFYKTSEPIRTKHNAFPEAARNLPKQISGAVSGELETLILNAVKLEKGTD